MSDLHMDQPTKKISIAQFKALSKDAVVFYPSSRERGYEHDGSLYYESGLGYGWWIEGDVVNLYPSRYRINNISLADLTVRMAKKLERRKAML